MELNSKQYYWDYSTTLRKKKKKKIKHLKIPKVSFLKKGLNSKNVPFREFERFDGYKRW